MEYYVWICVLSPESQDRITSILINSRKQETTANEFAISALSNTGKVCGVGVDDHDALSFTLAYNITTDIDTPHKVKEHIKKFLLENEQQFFSLIVSKAANCSWELCSTMKKKPEPVEFEDVVEAEQ